jgi:signal transduction histidine kinase
MERLIRDLLDATAIEAGTLTIEVEAHDVGSLLSEVAAMQGPLAAQRSLRLTSEVPATRLGVLCDRERVLQVFSNLIGNALKFTPAGGEVSVRAEPCGDEVRFAVSDTGPGIDPEAQRHIFDRYWKSRSSRAGTGLGLFIVKGLVEAQGGTIEVESAPGTGSVFHFTLPAGEGPGPS